MKKTFQFEATPSSNGECFQFEVDKENLIKLFDEQYYNKEVALEKDSYNDFKKLGMIKGKFKKPTKFLVSPHHFFNGSKKLKINIIIEEV